MRQVLHDAVAEALAEPVERLFLADVVVVLDLGDRLDLLLQGRLLRLGGVVLDEDLDEDAVLEARGALVQVVARHEDGAEDGRADEHGDHGRHGHDPVAAHGAERLAEEEAESHVQDLLLLGVRDLVVAAAPLVAHEAPLVELQHAPAHAVDHVTVVGGHHHGGPGPVDAHEQLHDADRRLRVDVARGLVGEQQRRVVDERARHADALLLAAADLVRVAVGLVAETDQAQDLRHLAADAAPRLADDLERVRHVVVDGLVGQQLEVLEHAADVAPQERHLAAPQGAEVAAGHEDAPRLRDELLEHQLDERRLAGAGGAHQEHELTLADVAGEVLEADHVRVVGLGDVFEDDHGISSPLSAVNGQAPIMRGLAGSLNPRPSVLVHGDRRLEGGFRPPRRRGPPPPVPAQQTGAAVELRRTSGASQAALVWPATPGKGSPPGRGFLPRPRQARSCRSKASRAGAGYASVSYGVASAGPRRPDQEAASASASDLNARRSSRTRACRQCRRPASSTPHTAGSYSSW